MRPTLDSIDRTLAPMGGVPDAAPGNWVDQDAPAWARPYLRLARIDRPVGTWLLLIPCWWGIALGQIETGWRLVDLWLYPAMAIGAVVMRGCGCVWNDITDRDIDAQVSRTAMRPLPSGQATVAQALGFMIALGLTGLCILLTLNWTAIALGVLALAPVCAYPFAKRFTWWPQVFLGVAFNWGALLAYAAHTGHVGLPSVLMYLAGIAWTLHYDTIYAHQDREDDALIGVRSTARLFGDDTAAWLWGFAGAACLLAALAVIAAGGGTLALLGPVAFGLHLAWQIRGLDIDDPALCLAIFRANRSAGLLLLAGLVLGGLG